MPHLAPLMWYLMPTIMIFAMYHNMVVVTSGSFSFFPSFSSTLHTDKLWNW